MAQRALTLHKKLLGATHPEVGLTLANLAVMQQALGRTTDATVSYRKAGVILEEALGSAHPTTATCRLNYGRLLATAVGP